MANPGQLHKFGIKPPSGYLLAGPSGTGKTHLARAVANEAGCVFYSLSAGELVSKWVGESEERLRNLFAAACKHPPSVLFLDEVDSIAGKRTSSPSNSEQHYARLLNQLLVCMDGFADTKGSVLILGATNRPEALDPAILRPGRFDEIIRIEPPGAQAREQMFRKRLEKMSPEPGLMDAIPELICRTAGMSPAELDRILREAAYLAARRNRDRLTRADLEAACNLVRYGAERPDVAMDDLDRSRIAWHEAGHAVAQLTLFPGSKLDYVSIVPSESGMLGFAAWQVDESRTKHTAADFRHLIMVALAGREAEKLCPHVGTDAINTGASDDLQRATAMAWDALTRFGFDESVGPLSIHGLPENLHGAFAHQLKPQLEAFLRDCQKKTAARIAEKKDLLEKFVEALMEKQALDSVALQTLLASASRPSP
jgi:cell division protease FtsH